MKTYKVKTTKIDYCIEYQDLYEQVAERFPNIEEDTEDFEKLVDTEIVKLKNNLPQELELEITCDKEDLDDMVCDAVSDETMWLVDLVNYEIIKEVRYGDA